MDSNKTSGIKINQIDLLACNFIVQRNDNDSENFCNLAIINLERRYDDDNNTMLLFVSFDIMHEVEDPLFSMICNFVVVYKQDSKSKNMTWDEFKNPIAVAHIIPYLREFVSNMTNRMPIPILNYHRLILICL
jgi:hypothetical protein